MIFKLLIYFLFVGYIFCDSALCGCNITEAKKYIDEYRQLWKQRMKVEDKPLWDDDMMMSPSMLDNYYNPDKINFIAALPNDFRWVNNTIPFYISNEFTDENKKIIIEAINEMQTKIDNCVKFIHYPNLPKMPKFVHVKNSSDNRCWTRMRDNYDDYATIVNFGKDSCLKKGTIQHEFMHAMGFHHEHARPDRDDFIQIRGDRIKSGRCHNFKKCVHCQTFDLPYDFGSVMHYSRTSSSCNGEETVIPLNKEEKIIYQRRTLSDLDVRRIRIYYQCEINE